MKRNTLQKELDRREAVRDEGYAEVESMILYLVISFIIIVAGGIYIETLWFWHGARRTPRAKT